MTTSSEPKICFVISPIGSEGSEVRVRADQILNHIIEPIASECGYKELRADKISEPGSITTQVINHILNDPMVIADLTGNNANVFYELAVRHAIRKPYVQIIQDGEKIPFDVAGIRTIPINHTNLDSVAKAKEEIKKQIQFTVSNPTNVESPISVAIDLEKLRQSGDPEKNQLADIFNGIVELKILISQSILARSEGARDTLRASELEAETLRHGLGDEFLFLMDMAVNGDKTLTSEDFRKLLSRYLLRLRKYGLTDSGLQKIVDKRKPKPEMTLEEEALSTEGSVD